jgi:hypothetical protein
VMRLESAAACCLMRSANVDRNEVALTRVVMIDDFISRPANLC